MTHLSIITGASRGLGLALTEQLLAQGHRVLAIARQPTQAAAPQGAELISWQQDLADTTGAAQRLHDWLAQQDAAQTTSATLINNAGVVSELASVHDVAAADLSNALRVGLEAPTLLTAAFLKATAGWKSPRKVLLISSGLGRRAMAGSASYCAAKAGMDHLARAVALEQAQDTQHGARIVSLAPGIIDTDMQVQLRGADPAAFPEHDKFVEFKRSGALDSPAQAAEKVLRFLARADFGSEPVTDVRAP